MNVAYALVFVFSSMVCFSQALGTKPGPIHYPESLELWDTKTSLTMSFMHVPEAVVEEANMIRWPSWEVDVFVGLPSNFVANARVTTQIINWHFLVGGKWQHEFSDELRSFLGLDFAYFRGGIGAGAFDNTNTSTFLYPNFSLGYDFGEVALTLRSEMNIVLSKTDRAGNVTVSEESAFVNGYSAALYLEQPFWGDTQFIIGWRANYLQYVYQNWLLFPTTDTFYFVPEFVVGMRL